MRRIFARIATASAFAIAAAALFGLAPARAEEIGRVGVDWIGNDIVVDAVEDPKVQGVTCHLAFFDRSIIDRLQQGNWFEDPSNSSIACRQTGPITVGDIKLGKGGEEVFNQRRSIILKTLVINRIYDVDHKTLVYLAHSRQVNQGSAKMSISTVPLTGTDVTWKNGEPSSR